jgi:1-acyl-sn-glycerol-3-phosphate acyltransferase
MAHEKHGPWYLLAKAILKPPLLAFTKRDWSGQEHIPRTGGAIIAVNHITYFDPITVAHFVDSSGRTARYLAKAELFEVKGIKHILRGSGQIPVHRLSRDAASSFRDAVAAVQRGQCVIFYPDGTVTRDPGLWPMVGKTGAARVALTTGAPVIPLAQWGAQDVLAPYGKKFHVFPRKTMHLKAGPPVDLSEFTGKELTPQVLQEATAQIVAAYTALLENIRGETAPAERFDPVKAGVAQTGDPSKQQAKGGPQ